MLEVLEAGLLSTVQDAGRPGHGHLGVPRAGAADGVALAVANLLVGAPAGAAAVEMTLLGCTFRVHADVLVATSGADMEAQVPEEGRPLAMAASHRLRAGTTLRFGAALDGTRTYLALAGGIAADEALGSSSTDPVAGMGGLGGRALQAGDEIRPAGATALDHERAWPAGEPASGVQGGDGPRQLSILPGPHLDRLPEHVAAQLTDRAWAVSPRSDRVGIRLEGQAIEDAGDLGLASLPMLPGAIQLPPGGRPILLMPDAPTVGGYPVPAVVIEGDRHVTGQLRPGDEVRFRWVDLATARRRASELAERLRDVAASLP